MTTTYRNLFWLNDILAWLFDQSHPLRKNIFGTLESDPLIECDSLMQVHFIKVLL